MKHSIFALPAILRPTLLLALASQSSFSVHDDLLAFPQYEVRFSEDFVSESLAQARLNSNGQPSDGSPSNVEQYRPSPSHTSNDGQRADEVKLEYESMLLEGQRYLCSVPQIPKPEESINANDTLTKAEQEKELARATDRGWELLSGMQGNCVYFISGWWSYRFCYNDGVRQFHQLPPSRGVPVYPPMEDPGVEGFTLGKYQGGEQDDATTKQEKVQESGLDVSQHSKKPIKDSAYGELVQRGESRYLVQRLDGGTKCDLTGRGRRIEVQFHCNPQTVDRITLIKETSTCAYLMVIQTPRLCHDVAFLPPQKDEPNGMICSPVLAEDSIEEYRQNLAFLKQADEAAKLDAATAAASAILTGSQPPQIVGDIVVGGHALVPEGLVLEKSTIVGGGKETYVDTVASSDGKTLSKEDMERLGFGDPNMVEKLRKELEKIAQGQEWKLDVIDTPRGRQYRAIIGDGEEKEKDKDKDKEKTASEGEEADKDREGSKEEYFKEEL